MNNGMKMDIKNGKLLIEIDVTDKAIAAAAPSNSGKTKLVASTGGFVTVGNVKVGLNVTAANK